MVKINEFEEHMKLQQPLLVKDVKNGTTSKGSPYLSLILQFVICWHTDLQNQSYLGF